jgi:hypothetical protein
MEPAQKLIKLFLLFLTVSILLSCGRENDEEPIEIPFTLEGNRIVIYAIVNGVEGRYFWDTGCYETITTIPLDNLLVVENDRVTDYTRYYIKDGIVINGHRLETTSIITNNPKWDNTGVVKSILKNEEFDGILDYYIFSGYWCELSFTESKIILHKNKPEKFSLSVSGYVTEEGHPCISVYIDNFMPLNFVVDTGWPIAFGFPKKIMQYIKPAEYREILTVNESYDNVYDVFETHYEIPVHSINVLDNVFDDKFIVTSYYNPFDEWGTIGVEYLQYYDLLFDITYNNEPKNNWHIWELYYITRFPDLDKNTLDLSDLRNAKPKVGLTESLTEQGGFIVKVWKPSIAYNEYSLMPGMTITHINGIFLNSLNADERSRLFYSLAEENCEITVINLDNSPRTIKRTRQ